MAILKYWTNMKLKIQGNTDIENIIKEKEQKRSALRGNLIQLTSVQHAPHKKKSPSVRPPYMWVHVYIQYILPYSPASRFECVKVSKEIMKLCKGDFDYKCTSEFIMKYAKFSIVSIKRKHCKIVNTNNKSPSSTRELWDQKLQFFEPHLDFHHLRFCSMSQKWNCPF